MILIISLGALSLWSLIAVIAANVRDHYHMKNKVTAGVRAAFR